MKIDKSGVLPFYSFCAFAKFSSVMLSGEAIFSSRILLLSARGLCDGRQIMFSAPNLPNSYGFGL